MISSKVIFIFNIILYLILFVSCGSDSPNNSPAKVEDYCQISETKENGEIISIDQDDWKSCDTTICGRKIAIRPYPASPNPATKSSTIHFNTENCEHLIIYMPYKTTINDNGTIKTLNDTLRLFDGEVQNGDNAIDCILDNPDNGCYRVFFENRIQCYDSLAKMLTIKTLKTYGDIRVQK